MKQTLNTRRQLAIN